MVNGPVQPQTETHSPASKAEEKEPAVDSAVDSGGEGDPSRRDLLSTALSTGVVLSLGVSYGTLGSHAVKYLVPSQTEAKAWLYVASCAAIPTGGQVKYKAPSGAAIAVARVGEANQAESFFALSSTCPHMGCQVLWEGNKNRFFCPCHNGVFNDRGEGVDGPPKGQSLSRYPVKVDNGLLFVEVPVSGLPRERNGEARAAVTTTPDCRGEGLLRKIGQPSASCTDDRRVGGTFDESA